MEHFALKTRKTPQIKRSFFNDAFGLDSDIVNSVAYSSEAVLYVATDKGLFFFDKKIFIKISAASGSINVVYPGENGKMFAAGDRGVYIVDGGIVTASQQLEEPLIDICSDDAGALWAASKSYLYKYLDGEFKLICDIEFKDTQCFTACCDGNVYAASKKSLMMLFGKRPRWGNMMRGMTNIPDTLICTLSSDKYGHVWAGCEDGVYLYDGRSFWLSPDSLQFFPKCRINKIVFGFDDSIYLASDVGLYIVNGEKTRFFAKGRYLPGNKVVDIAVSEDGGEIWAATTEGLSRIEKISMTLAEKEAYYDSLCEHFKREDYITKRAGVVNGELTSGEVIISDNDGLYTAVYVAAESLKYAITKDTAALENARRSMNAMLKLMTMTGIEGFPARAYRRPGEDLFGDGDSEWHLSSDEKGALEWKGETSSDELVGHYYAASWYYDLCADKNEKKKIAAVVKSITEHILTHDYTLCDTDGQPTTWAHFGPQELNLDDKWCWEQGINSLELLSFLRITEHMTGEAKYADKAKELIEKHHYALNILTYKKYDAHSNHIDDRLGFYIITPLLRYEKDAFILRFIKLALRRHFEYERIEHCPYFSFVYAAFTGSHADIAEAVEILEEFPLDLNGYNLVNSIRPDIEIDYSPMEFGEAPQTKKALPASERSMQCLCYGAFTLDRNEAAIAASPSSWLLAYWFARYYGLIE